MALSLVVIAGLSGAGRTTALKALEDQGYQTIDNLPISMVPTLVAHIIATNNPKLTYAVGIDAKSLHPQPLAIEIIQNLQVNAKIDLKVIFLDCAPEKIQQRYNESRRPHPIPGQKLGDAIATERTLLLPFSQIAEMQLDTTELNVRHMRLILQHYLQEQKEARLKIQLLSFSYKKGAPKFADLVLDMRFLSNPFYDAKLKPLTGKNEQVQAYIKEDSRWPIIEHHLREFLVNAIQGYQEQGRFYLNLAFGCTGGQHRSVFATEYFYNILKKLHYDCIVEHRDLTRELTKETS
jgi:RNase adapter protein RapZ